MFIQDIDNKESIPCCGHCGRIVGPLGFQLAFSAGATVQDLMSEGELNEQCNEMFFYRDGTIEEYQVLTCGMGCGVMYCSDECRRLDFIEYGHSQICVGQCAGDHPIYQFKVFAFSTGYYNEFCLAQKLLARILISLDDSDDQVKVWDQLFKDVIAWEKFDDAPSQIADWVNESYALLYSGMPELVKHSSFVDKSLWSRLVSFILRTNLEVSIHSTPLAEYCHLLNQQPLEIQQQAVAVFVETVKDDEGEPATLGSLLSEPKRFFPPLSGIFVSTDRALCNLKHSCIPSTKVTWEITRKNGVSYKLETSNSNTSRTVCLVDETLDLESRVAELKERGIQCECDRCKFETGQGTDLSDTRLEELLEQAQSDMRLDDALELLDVLLGRNDTNTFWLYTKSRVLGWNDEWTASHVFLVDALERLKTAPKKSLEGAKLEEYYTKMQLLVERENTFAFSDIEGPISEDELEAEFEKVDVSEGESAIFVSKEGHPVLPVQECANIIQAAQEHSKSCGGWTTNRHYSVPTTDFSVFDVPGVSTKLAELFRTRLYPTLGAQFEIDPCSIRVIDAFIVKYEAGAQSFLPVHTDQSQFSCTIALNSMSDYTGGGTWFADLDKALNCDTGGVVAFDGAMSHGGHCISSGERFIIAVFMYSSDET
mmetsp:Transcript_11192/g.20804  ORF Transcript_11192/g.20804 Transcript_11192/m.20804 type:complete len:653 (+) Transcript_11192:385-2343(+)|eukprot:CAMPEP_0203747294 /NCGR_PEP_ID=MMETSP0098-20131031/2483_1 /ASSEMBLY_ACC=CAM_ASM_000208 /TAXON_ID=96639 /ORGANISM=" , Strain NY0313808BC1" /LENGTH=652 /DNA_ID=CAMNT_0050635673 /DNA_START=993 /DNA_END=2951 /DNA_ORIENTATION=+